jgi:hypothetical protein
MKFNEAPLDVFWISIRKEYLLISAKGVKILLQFSTSYLFQQAFSCLTNIKSEDKSSAFCRGRIAAIFVINSAKNSTFLQK